MALTAHQNSIIFRREYPQLKGIIQRSKKIIKKRGKYNSTEKTWSLDDGRILEFGACQYEEDAEKFQGRAHDLKIFDEICHFSKFQYKFLSGWNRTADENQRARTLATGNPPTTAEGRWVIEYWAPWLDPKHPNPAVPGELRWFVVVVDEDCREGRDVEVPNGDPVLIDGEWIKPRSRTFVPAKIDDNPYYAKTNYKSVLASLPEPLRSQMLKGDFSAGIEDDPWQLIPTEWVEAAQARWKSQKPVDARGVTIPLTTLGVDPARGGNDKTTLAPRYGHYVDTLIKKAGKSTPDGKSVADLVAINLNGEAYGNIDVTGIGSSPYDRCVERGLNVYACSGGDGSSERDRSGKFGFRNKRAEWYWRLREALDPKHGDNIALPPDKELLADLTAPRWKITPGNDIQVESKDDIKKRIGRSPDCGDAVVYSFVHPEISVWGENTAMW